jgi:hypothetical protein
MENTEAIVSNGEHILAVERSCGLKISVYASASRLLIAYKYVASDLFQGDVQHHPFCLMDIDITNIFFSLDNF